MRAVVAVLLLFACAPRENAPPPSTPKPRPAIERTQEFHGTYSVGDERITFEVCGTHETWWVSFSPEARRQMTEHGISGWGRWPMTARAVLSPKGIYGHLGGYSRLLYVVHVIDFERPEGC